MQQVLGTLTDETRGVGTALRSEAEVGLANLILEAVGEGIYGIDAEGLTTFWNPAAEAMTGWKTEEVLGKSPHPLIHHSHPDGTPYPIEECALLKTASSGLVHIDHEIFWRKDGTPFSVECTATPILLSGRDTGAVVVFKDITERMRREKAGLAASQAKADFLSNISHEIRTPMNGVLGMIQLLLSTQLTPEQQHYAEIAHSSGRTLLALLDDILDLSKIEAGKTVLEKLNFNLAATVDDVVSIWRIQACAKGLTFKLRLAPEAPPNLCGDPGRLRQILNNLISNAIKFTERGTVALHVETVADDHQRLMLRFSVEDSGIGMRPDQVQKLFEPFVQADSSTTRKYGGSGLGLVICKRLVDLMGGEIGIHSQEGQGSTFWFTVVLEGAAAAPAPMQVPVSTNPLTSEIATTPHQRETSPVEGPGAGCDVVRPEKCRILVAEDNPTNRVVIMAQLRKLGYHAETVSDGAEAVEAASHGLYDMILMDCEMPILDGYEATRRIRSLGIPRVPIIALTAHAMSGHRELCLSAGMDYFLSKPLDLQRLARVLKDHRPDLDGANDHLRLVPAVVQTTSNVAVFDAQALLKRLMDDRGLAELVIEGFVGDCPVQLAVLEKCIAGQDGPGVRLQAHALKGSSASVSAVRLSTIALAMEMAAGSGRLDDCDRLMSSAADAFEQFKTELADTGWLRSPGYTMEEQ